MPQNENQFLRFFFPDRGLLLPLPYTYSIAIPYSDHCYYCTQTEQVRC